MYKLYVQILHVLYKQIQTIALYQKPWFMTYIRVFDKQHNYKITYPDSILKLFYFFLHKKISTICNSSIKLGI